MLPNEDELIRILTSQLPTASNNIILAAGDDTAVISYNQEHDLLYTIDAFVENVHFNFSYCSPEDVGWKALAINLSDIAAMGGSPLAALVSLIIPKNFNDTQTITKIYNGLTQCSQQFNCPIVGGNISSSPKGLILDITVIGLVPKAKAWKRSGAKPGNLVAVTGVLGSSKAGYEILNNPMLQRNSLYEPLKTAHLHPYPRLDLIEQLRQSGLVYAAMDISDGL
jgi:thiamine-monophosphate kinase